MKPSAAAGDAGAEQNTLICHYSTHKIHSNLITRQSREKFAEFGTKWHERRPLVLEYYKKQVRHTEEGSKGQISQHKVSGSGINQQIVD